MYKLGDRVKLKLSGERKDGGPDLRPDLRPDQPDQPGPDAWAGSSIKSGGGRPFFDRKRKDGPGSGGRPALPLALPSDSKKFDFEGARILAARAHNLGLVRDHAYDGLRKWPGRTHRALAGP